MTGIALLVVAAGALALMGCFALLEVAVRRQALPTQLTRRIAHVLAALYAIVVYVSFPVWAFVAVCAFFVVVMAVSRARHILTSIHRVQRRSLGELYLPTGLALAAVVVGDDTRAFVAATLIMGLADVAAGLTGETLRSPHKTWQGSAAFLAVAFVVLVVSGFSWLIIGVVAVATTITERFSPRGSDNITVPVVAALLLLVLQA